jgi:hypothetical protein
MPFTTRSQLNEMTAQVARRDALVASWCIVARHGQSDLYEEQRVRALYPVGYTFVYKQRGVRATSVYTAEGEVHSIPYEMVVRDAEGCWVCTHFAWVLGTEADAAREPCALLDAEPTVYPPTVAPVPCTGPSADLLDAVEARLTAAGL